MREFTARQLVRLLREQINRGDPIILATPKASLPAGHRFTGIGSGIKGAALEQPFIVVREATFDEWWLSLPQKVQPEEGYAANKLAAMLSATHFYEVVTD